MHKPNIVNLITYTCDLIFPLVSDIPRELLLSVTVLLDIYSIIQLYVLQFTNLEFHSAKHSEVPILKHADFRF